MAEMIQRICNFSTGEVSPTLNGRFDLSLYESACRNLDNAIIMEEGGATRRMGTLYMGECKYHDRHTRLIPFYYSTTVFCNIEMGDKYLRFWNSKGIIKKDDKLVELVSPYKQEDLYNVKYVQSADVIYFVHPEHPPYKLTRGVKKDKLLSGEWDEWTLEEYELLYPVFKDVNITDTTITLKEESEEKPELGEAISNEDLFTLENVNEIWMVSQPREDNQIIEEYEMKKGGVEKTFTSDAIECKGQFNILTHDKWKGNLLIERSEVKNPSKDEDWTTVREFKSDYDYNVNYNGDEKFEDILYRIKVILKDGDEDDNKISFEFTVYENFRDVLFKIDEFVNAKKVLISFPDKKSVSDKACKNWCKPEWTEEDGYPNVVTIYEERLWFGRKTKVWGSNINDWAKYEKGSLDTDALYFSVPSADNIQWMLTGKDLFLGAEGRECTLGDNDDNTPLTPTNIPKVKIESSNGSCYIQAEHIGDSVVYCQSHAKTINEFSYNWQSQKYDSPNLTLLSRHITGDGITEMSFATKPQPILWCVRSDGKLIGMTYNRSQKIMGWHKHDVNGNVESISVVPFGYANEDCLWMIVNRTINGVNKKYIERFSDSKYNDEKHAIFLDSTIYNFSNPVFNIVNMELDTKNYILEVTCSESLGAFIVEGSDVKIWQYGQPMDQLILNNVKIIDTNTFTGYCTINKIGDKTGTCARVENTFVNLEHLEGETVQGLMDGAPTELQKVKDGKVVFNMYGKDVAVGKQYKSVVEPMPISIQTSAGSSQPYPLKLTSAIIKFFRSEGAYIEVNGKKETVNWRTIYDRMGFPVTTGIVDKEILIGSTFERTLSLSAVQEQPLPMTVLNIMPYFLINNQL